MRKSIKSTTGKSIFSLPLAVLMMALLLPTGALAQQPASETESWQFGVSIYGWFPDIAGQTSFTQTDGSDEFEIAGLTKAPCRLVKSPRVEESPINLECRTWKVVELPTADDGSRTTMVIGEVVGVHIAEDAFTDGLVDTPRLKPVSRLGYRDYCVVDKAIMIKRPDSKISK